MKERPILFSAPMVRAIREGRKTQTRRIVKCAFQSIEENDDGVLWPWREDVNNATDHWYPCPYGQPGDRLWVRETWCDFDGDGPRALYKADADVDGSVPYLCTGVGGIGGGVCNHTPEKWRSPIFMLRWASRILLEIVSVRVERLQEISEKDAKAEGVIWHEAGQFWQPSEDINCPCCFAYGAYAELWQSINGPESWDANPWVWVIEFKRMTP